MECSYGYTSVNLKSDYLEVLGASGVLAGGSNDSLLMINFFHFMNLFHRILYKFALRWEISQYHQSASSWCMTYSTASHRICGCRLHAGALGSTS